MIGEEKRTNAVKNGRGLGYGKKIVHSANGEVVRG